MILSGQSMNSEKNTAPKPVFLKNLGQKGYRKESSSDSDEETISGKGNLVIYRWLLNKGTVIFVRSLTLGNHCALNVPLLCINWR